MFGTALREQSAIKKCLHESNPSADFSPL